MGLFILGTFNCEMLWAAIRDASCLLSPRCAVGVSQSARHREQGRGCKVKFPFQFSCLGFDALC